MLGLVHRLLAEGQNLQHFCREAIGHFRNLLVARVCGADSDLIAAPAEERPRLARAAAAFSEEDLTRFFQILLHTEDDLRRKPDPRLHLEMGLLRLVNAARLAPLEEILAELSGTRAASSIRRSPARDCGKLPRPQRVRSPAKLRHSTAHAPPSRRKRLARTLRKPPSAAPARFRAEQRRVASIGTQPSRGDCRRLPRDEAET